MKLLTATCLGFIFSFSLFSNDSAHALDPIVSGTVGAGLKKIGDSIFENIDDSVDNFFDNVDDSAANIRTLTDGLLASATADLDKVLNKSIEELNTQERQVWNYYFNMMNDLDRRVAGYLKEGRYTMLHAGNIVNEVVPFSSDKPQIFWIEAEPPFYNYGATKRTITAYGLNLDHSKNKLVSGNKEGTRLSLSPTKLSFQFENIDVKNGMPVDYELWEDRWFRDKKRDIPQITLPSVQDYLGDIALIYTSKNYTTVDRQYPATGNPHRIRCRNSRYDPSDRCSANSGTQTLTANQGFSILPDTISLDQNSTSSCEYHNANTSNENSNSFNWRHSARAESGLGRRCWGTVRVKWQEITDDGETVRNVTAYKPLKRSLRGASFDYPLNNADPVGMSFKPIGSDEPQSLDLSSLRWPIETFAQPDTGIIEVNWLK